MAELPERLSAQVITTVDDYSRLDTTPTTAVMGVITATKGPLDELHLVQTTTALTTLFGEPSSDHLGLVGAYKIIASGVGMYLVRVANPNTAKEATATISGTKPAVVVNDLLVTEPNPAGNLVATDRTTDPILDTWKGSYTVTGILSEGDRTWTGTFGEEAIQVVDDSQETGTSTLKIGTTGIVIELTGVENQETITLTFEAIGSETVTTPANVLLKMKEVGTYGNDYTVDVAKETDTEKYTFVLKKGNFKKETLTVSLDSEAEDYILDASSEFFTIELVDSSFEPTALTNGVYEFSGGYDGGKTDIEEHIEIPEGEIDSLTKAYIGEIDESTGEATGSKLFLQPKVVAQMYPSLGYCDKLYLNAMKAVSEQKKYVTCVFDTPAGLTMNQVCQWVNNDPDSKFKDDPVLSGWMCEVYWPWINDTYNGYPLLMPPSVYITINSMDWWQRIGPQLPVAGNPRGILSNVSAGTEIPSVVDRDKLVTNRINPIFNTGTAGTQIYGNETLNNDYTDLRSAHIARQLAQIITNINRMTERFEFELNDSITWQSWIDAATRILQGYSVTGGLKWFGVKMGLDTTTAAEIAQRQIRGLIGLQFNQDAEVFWLNYAVYASSAEEIDF